MYSSSFLLQSVNKSLIPLCLSSPSPPTTSPFDMSSTTASSTRSSSPASSDSLSDGQPTTFQPVDFSAWLHPFSPDSEAAPWNGLDHSTDIKFDDNSLLMLEEFANDGAFEYVSFFSASVAQAVAVALTRSPVLICSR